MEARYEMPSGRFDQHRLAKRIDQAREAKGMTIKAFCAKVGWDKSVYSRKITHPKTPLYIPECERAAEALGMPLGWPFVSAEDAGRLEDHHEGRARIVRNPSG